MAVSMKWEDDAQSILLVTFTSEVTKEDFLSAYNGMGEFFDSVPHMVCVVADFRATTRVPMNLLSVSSSLTGRNYANLAGLAVVGTNSILKVIIDVWSKLYRQMTMVPTLEAAYAWAKTQLANA